MGKFLYPVKYDESTKSLKNMVQLRESWMTCSWSHRKVVSKLISYVDSLESCKIIRSNGKEALKRPRNLFVSHTYIHVYINTILSTTIENIDENESWWHSFPIVVHVVAHSLSYVEIHYEISSDSFVKGTVWRYTQSGLASSVSVSLSGSLTRMVAASGEPP